VENRQNISHIMSSFWIFLFFKKWLSEGLIFNLPFICIWAFVSFIILKFVSLWNFFQAIWFYKWFSCTLTLEFQNCYCIWFLDVSIPWIVIWIAEITFNSSHILIISIIDCIKLPIWHSPLSKFNYWWIRNLFYDRCDGYTTLINLLSCKEWFNIEDLSGNYPNYI